MIDRAAKTFFHLLARSSVLKKMASRYGMRRPTSFARRFIAGETVEEAIEAARALERKGLHLTLDLLGESVTSLDSATVATREYLDVIDAMIASGIERFISLKLTQLGLDVDKATAVDNLRRILERTEPTGFFVRIDMENSPYTAVTLEIFETLWQQGYRQMGVVLQSALYRSERDLERLSALGVRVRLVKGAYKEPKTVAYQKKAEVDAAYTRMVQAVLTTGHFPAIATHDPAMIRFTLDFARYHQVAADSFEFQMLYGIRRDLQASLVNEGYRVRVYVPFGREWFPYFMRRLAERPPNVLFVARGILEKVGNKLLRNEQTASIHLMWRRRVWLSQAFAQSLLRWTSPQVLIRSTLNLRRLLPARLLKSPEPQVDRRRPYPYGSGRQEEQANMVTNYPHPVASDRGVRTATVETQVDELNVIDRLRQMFCGLHGHDNLLQFEQERMFLKCVSCGHQTPGWSLNEAPPTVTARGDARRHALVQPRFMSVRRIA